MGAPPGSRSPHAQAIAIEWRAPRSGERVAGERNGLRVRSVRARAAPEIVHGDDQKLACPRPGGHAARAGDEQRRSSVLERAQARDQVERLEDDSDSIC